MAKAFNPINFPAGFNIDLAVPIDSRVIVDTKSSLTSSDYWMDDTYPIKLYNGLICAVQDSGEVYVLMNKDNYTVETSWKKVGADIDADDVQEIIEQAVGDDLSEITQSITDINQDITTINNMLSWGEIPSATPAE
jgi:hypothetical protein